MTRLNQWLMNGTGSSIGLIGVGVAVLMTFVFAFGVVAPVALRASQQVSRAQDLARHRQRANGVSASIREIKAKMQQTQARIAATPLRVSPVDRFNERLAGLIALAGECGLAVQDVKPGEAAAVRKYSVVPVRLTGGGRYSDCSRFLHRLRDRLPEFAVGGFQLTAEGSGGPARCQFDLRWFGLLESSPPAAVAAVPLQ